MFALKAVKFITKSGPAIQINDIDGAWTSEKDAVDLK
jgi:hypothetical protein